MDRDTDASIVKEIYNWRYIPISGDFNGENICQVLFPPNIDPDQGHYNQLPRIGKPHEGFFAPRFSSNLTEAITLALKIKLPLTICEAFDRGIDPELLTQKCLEHFRKQ